MGLEGTRPPRALRLTQARPSCGPSRATGTSAPAGAGGGCCLLLGVGGSTDARRRKPETSSAAEIWQLRFLCLRWLWAHGEGPTTTGPATARLIGSTPAAAASPWPASGRHRIPIRGHSTRHGKSREPGAPLPSPRLAGDGGGLFAALWVLRPASGDRPRLLLCVTPWASHSLSLCASVSPLDFFPHLKQLSLLSVISVMEAAGALFLESTLKGAGF